MSIIVKIKRLYGKMFMGGYWKVAYRNRDNENSPYTLIHAPEGTWIADPLMWEYNGEHYLFVELFDKKKDKAGIAYYRFIDDKPVFQKQVLEEAYHLSYPCIFSWQGKIFMIPESAAGNTLDIYRADIFPNEWVWDSNLIKGEKYVDTTVFEKEGDLFALGYHKIEKGWGLTLFRLDMIQRRLIRITEKKYPENTGRPAGYILHDESLRPAQDCSCMYGEAIIWYKIDEMGKTGFNEHIENRMRASDICVDGKPDRVHTYSRDRKFEVVDLRFNKLDFFHGIKTIMRAINGSKHK